MKNSLTCDIATQVSLDEKSAMKVIICINIVAIQIITVHCASY